MALEFRDLPAIDRLLSSPEIAPLAAAHGEATVKGLLRELQSSWRANGGLPDWAADPASYAEAISARLEHAGYRPVFNLTGTVIHTNLGRALISRELYQAVEPLVTRPINLEYDLAAGKRGDREKFVEDRLTLITGAEAATVVNNGAAALMLVLNTLALGRNVPVSRGELIEIGGSFRLPDIMTRSGCELREVGTTNRTHPRDYAAAIDEHTGLLLKVHPSNFYISGFTSTVETNELTKLAAQHGLPLVVDLGSGTLIDLTRHGLPHEPTPREVLAQGADLITFSGDKLLGGPQAGIIVGKAQWVAALKQNPMKRALRPDKLTLAFLEQTLKLYEDPDTLPDKLPLLKTLTTPLRELEARGARVQAELAGHLTGHRITLEPSECQIGSGALPDRRIESRAVVIDHDDEARLRDLQSALRKLPVPVIGRLNQGRLWLDMRGAELTDELCDVLAALGSRT